MQLHSKLELRPLIRMLGEQLCVSKKNSPLNTTVQSELEPQNLTECDNQGCKRPLLYNIAVLFPWKLQITVSMTYILTIHTTLPTPSTTMNH